MHVSVQRGGTANRRDADQTLRRTILMLKENIMSQVQEIARAVETGKMKDIQGLVEAALAAGADPVQILNEGMIGAMGVVG